MKTILALLVIVTGGGGIMTAAENTSKEAVQLKMTIQKQQLSMKERLEQSRQAALNAISHVETFDRHLVVHCKDGSEEVLYRRDLTRPAIELTGVKQEGRFYHYTYKVSNGADAVEAITFVHLIAPGSPVGLHIANGIQPGKSETFTVRSNKAPGEVQALMVNHDAVDEGEYLRKVRPEPAVERILNDDCSSGIGMSGKMTPLITVMGPAVPPSDKKVLTDSRMEQ